MITNNDIEQIAEKELEGTIWPSRREKNLYKEGFILGAKYMVDKLQEKSVKQQVEDMINFGKTINTPEKAKAFLQSAGILGADGEFTEPYK